MWYKLSKCAIDHFHEGVRFNKQMLRAFIAANKFNEATFSRPKDYANLLRSGKFAHNYRNIELNTPPYIDHDRIFKNTETGAICLIYHPYKEAVESFSAIEQWANDNGLKADIYSPEYSWYYQGETLLIVIHAIDTEIPLR